MNEDVSSVSAMTANVSDPQDSSGPNGNEPQFLPSHPPQMSVPPSQMSPPRPISTLQHNYSNIQQPAPVMIMGGRNLPTPPPQQHQQLGLPQPPPMTTTTTAPTSSASSASPMLHLEGGSGAFSKSAVRPRTPTRSRDRGLVSAEEARKSTKLAEMQDLIHLERPLTEDSIMRALQARFFNQKYYVSKTLHIV